MVKKILLNRDNEKFYIRELKNDFHTNFGFIPSSSLKKNGKVTTNTGKEFTLFDSNFIDVYDKLKRHAQIISLKEIGAIIACTGIGRDSFVVDAGAGTGALACFIANIAKKVVTYDIDERSLAATNENVELLGLKNIKVKNGNVYEKVDEEEVDVFTLDVPEPWKAFDNISKCLKLGGFLVAYSPQITQSQRTVVEAGRYGFLCLKTTELIEREWVLDERRARPDFQGLGHTGFLSFFRKI